MNKQISLSALNDELAQVRTKKNEFLVRMERIIPWTEWLALIKPCYYKGERGNQPYSLELMLRLYLLQNLYNLSDEATVTEAIDSRAFSEFCGVDSSNQVPDGDTLGRFRNLLIKNGMQEKLFAQVVGLLQQKGLLLRKGTIVDSTLIEAPSSTKNREKQRDRDAHAIKLRIPRKYTEQRQAENDAMPPEAKTKRAYTARRSSPAFCIAPIAITSSSVVIARSNERATLITAPYTIGYNGAFKAKRCGGRSDASGDVLVNSEPILWWFAHDGYVYGSPLEWDEKFKNYAEAEYPTVRLKLSGGALETVGDFHPSTLRPAGEYLVRAGVYGETRNHPVLMRPDGSEAKPLPLG